MRIPQGTSKLTCLKDIYEQFKNANANYYERFERNAAQYQGDDKIDNSPDLATVVWNITYELIESQVSTEIPAPKVAPRVWNKKSMRNARAIERLCLALRDNLPFERLNDRDERNTYIYGASAWLVEWDESIRRPGTVGDITIQCLSPADLVWDKSKREVQESECIFIRYRTTRAELVRKFGVSWADVEAHAELESDDIEHADADEEVCSYVVAFYKDDDGNICKLSWSGDLVLEDYEDYYARRRTICEKCGKREELCTCEHPRIVEQGDEYEELDPDKPIILQHFADVVRIDPATGKQYTERVNETIPGAVPVLKDDGTPVTVKEETAVTDPQTGNVLLGDDGKPVTAVEEVPKMRPTRLPYFKPKMFPIVVRRNVSEEDSIIGKSDCDILRPYQQQVNKLESRIQAKLMRSGVTPVLPDDAEISLNNTVFGQAIRLKPGENRSQYGVLDTTPNVAAEQQQAERVYDHAKRALGITDSYQGNADNTAKSGIAKQAQIQQAAGRLLSKREMKKATMADLYRIVFELYLAFSDEPRHVSYVDEFGARQNIDFNRYDFFEEDPTRPGEYLCNDDYLFSCDQSSLLDQQREQMWQVNLNNLTSGALGNPQDPAVLLRYWMNQERAHYPNAADNVEYFKTIVQQMANAQNGGQNNVKEQQNVV